MRHAMMPPLDPARPHNDEHGEDDTEDDENDDDEEEEEEERAGEGDQGRDRGAVELGGSLQPILGLGLSAALAPTNHPSGRSPTRISGP